MIKTLKHGTQQASEFLEAEHTVVSVTQVNNIVTETVELNTGEIAIIIHSPLARNILSDYLYAN